MNEPDIQTEVSGTTHVVDDDPMFLDALSLTLEHAGLNVKTYRSGQEFFENYRADGTSCLLLDISLPDLDGLQVQKRLAARRDPIPIVFVTGHGDVSTSVAALRNGAFHFLEKPIDDGELLSSIDEALRRDRDRREGEAEHAQVLNQFQRLTAREQQIMSMVVRDNSSKQIARTLGISPRTVEHHRAHIMKKMHATSLNELVIMSVICGVRELRL